MSAEPWGFVRRVESLRIRIGSLSSMRKLVALPPEQDISPEQWRILESRLAAVAARLDGAVNRAFDVYLGSGDELGAARRLNASLGAVELDLSRAFTFFDTYVDVLTQRRATRLGSLLAGCDVLAADALRRDHPALSAIELPLVYCDRGFGASILREEIRFPDGTPNPMPLVQIPYARLQEKYNLTSVFHEAGHQALKRLRLVPVVPRVLRSALAQGGASLPVQSLYALWSSEIGPDFWTFCCAGMAGASGLRDLLSLPPSLVYRVSAADPHPPPYVRVLLGFELCRQAWGQGPWDGWERRWRQLYPLPRAASGADLLVEAARFVPTVASALLTTRYRTLGGRAITHLFDLGALDPERLRAHVGHIRHERAPPPRLAPCQALAAFSVLREQSRLSERTIDGLMTTWLAQLGRRRDEVLDDPILKRGGYRHAR